MRLNVAYIVSLHYQPEMNDELCIRCIKGPLGPAVLKLILHSSTGFKEGLLSLLQDKFAYVTKAS